MGNILDLSASDLQAIQKAVAAMPFYELDSDLHEYVLTLSLSVNNKIANSAAFSMEEALFIQEAIGYAQDALQGAEPLSQELKDGLRPFLFTFNSLSKRFGSFLD